MTDRGYAVEALGVGRRYGAIRALVGVDLKILRGTTLAVFGSNGAGKTTLLRILAGLARPTAGEARVFGVPLPGDHRLRRSIGLLGHETFLYGDLTALENLEYYARLYAIHDRSRVGELLEMLGLAEAADRPLRTYSRGMQQRIALARAVLHEPQLLLLDEPFAGLDPTASDLLSAVLARLHARHVTVVLTTHDFDRGLAVADDAVLLHRGRVAWDAHGDVPDRAGLAEIYAAVAAR